MAGKTRMSESQICSIANDCFLNAVAEMQKIAIGDMIAISAEKKKIVGIVSSKHKNLIVIKLKNYCYSINIPDFITSFHKFTITKKSLVNIFET